MMNVPFFILLKSTTERIGEEYLRTDKSSFLSFPNNGENAIDRLKRIVSRPVRKRKKKKEMEGKKERKEERKGIIGQSTPSSAFPTILISSFFVYLRFI